MEQRITPAIMVIASILVLSVLLMGSILVNGIVSSTDERIGSESEALRLIPTTNSVENESDDESEEEDVAITGTPLERASSAALAVVGQGRVTDTEVGDEDGYYEIEIWVYKLLVRVIIKLEGAKTYN